MLNKENGGKGGRKGGNNAKEGRGNGRRLNQSRRGRKNEEIAQSSKCKMMVIYAWK